MPKTKKIYTCEKCARTFERKSGYDDHMKKKNDCSKSTAIAPILEENKVLKKEVKEMRSMGPVTKENMSSFFENLHNLLWNRAGLSPERALEHMTFFFAYRMIEAQVETLHLPEVCRWSYINCLQTEQDLYDTIEEGTVKFNENDITRPFFKQHDIKSTEDLWNVVHEINRITDETLQESDVLGDIFEYLLSRGMSTMADDGQYYTNRTICRLAFVLSYRIKKTLRRPDGTLCTFGDWFCGTGGFPAEYIRGVKENLEDVNWERDSASIYCQDMNMSSVMTTMLNLLIQTGNPFNRTKETIRSGNSFQQNITMGQSPIYPGLTLDYEFLNPPYGGDKSKGKAYKFAYAKGKGKDKHFLVNKDIQSIGVEDDDKVSAGVQLAMATLAPEGICAIVLPQGFFFGASNKCVELRKKLAEEYKIHYVVDIASGSFINTGTKTSMMVFQKGVGPTETVAFIGLDESPLVNVSLDELRAKQFSLNYKKYLLQEEVVMDGFEMVRLGELVTIATGKNKTPDDKKGSLYPYYGTSGITGYTDYFLEDGEYILTARNGTIGNTFLIKGKSYPSDHMFTFRTNDRCLLTYLYYWMMSNKHIMINLANVTTIPGITRASLIEIKIPLPSLEKQQEIVFQRLLLDLAHDEEALVKKMETLAMLKVKMMGYGQPRVKLGEVCDFKRGKMITKKELINGTFPVIGGGLTPMGTHNISNREEYTPLISQSGENAGHISRYAKPVWASDCFSVSSTRMSNDFLYYSLLHIQDNINFLKTGTAQPHIYPSSIDHLLIPLPPLAEQERLQSFFDDIRYKYAKIAEYRKKEQEAIVRFIPGAHSETVAHPITESHSSTCSVDADGVGCDCKKAMAVEVVEAVEKEETEEPLITSLPSSTLETPSPIAPLKKMRRPVAAKTQPRKQDEPEAEK